MKRVIRDADLLRIERADGMLTLVSIRNQYIEVEGLNVRVFDHKGAQVRAYTVNGDAITKISIVCADNWELVRRYQLQGRAV